MFGDRNSKKHPRLKKNKLTKVPLLAHFNPKLSSELGGGASRDGLGIILLQEVYGKMHL